jgi:outer membrane protein OmpA-like peptidoglycan-associated protein
VRFDYDSAHLTPTALASLDEATRILRQHPDVIVEVDGYADSRGSDAYNVALSQRRAQAVRGYLVENGVTNRLTVQGYGESQPVADNSTDAGRARNRRVVLLIVSQ